MTPAQKNLLLRVARRLEEQALAEYDREMSAHPAAGSNSKTQETAKRKRDRELGDARDLRDLAREPEPQTPWNQQTIARFVDRFLSWPLPETFRPDNGITFVPPSIGWPVGTNILNADEARAMFEHVLGVSK